MSRVTSSAGRAWNCSQVHVRGSSTAPLIVNDHWSSEVCGVGPADNTGKSLTTYWPGGTRSASARSASCRRWKPRENGGLMAAELTPGREPSRRSDFRSAGTGQAVVVQAHERDHVVDVRVALDPAGGGPDFPREDRVVDDAPLLVQLGPHALGEAEVGGAVAVQVADLAPADLERELAATARPGLDALPRGDLVGDLLARCALLGHGTSV